MDNTVAVTFLSIFINRITEALKRSFITGLAISDDAKGTIVLILSFVLGILGVVFLFPATNLVPNAGASSPLAAQIVTGIIIAGLSNGIDFLGRIGGAVAQNSQPAATITLPTNSTSTDNSTATGTVTVTTGDGSPIVKAP